ncbi:MAG: DUF1579 family protein [Acidimicrobiia bacterium]
MTTERVLSSIPKPLEPGGETDLLRPFHRDGTWSGHIRPGGMGPGTPAQTAVGRARHRWIQGGQWVVGDYEQDQYLEDGTFVLKWELHWVCGWDAMSSEYKATIADNYGRAAILRGRIEGDRMVFESMGEVLPRLRLTWELEGGEVLWKNEMSLDGVDWVLVEDYVILPESRPLE